MKAWSRRFRSATLVLLCATATASSFGCKKPAKRNAQTLAPLTPAEQSRAKEACAAYVEKACACASAAVPPDKTRLDEECGLSKSLPSSLKIALEVATAGDLGLQDQAQTQQQVKLITKTCVESLARLAQGCAVDDSFAPAPAASAPTAPTL